MEQYQRSAGLCDRRHRQGPNRLRLNGDRAWLDHQRVPIATATYPAGASFPVLGTIADPQCLAGTETFSGTLISQESQITGQGTKEVSVKLIGMRLLGDATCKTLFLIPLFVTHYDLAVAGPEEDRKVMQDLQLGVVINGLVQMEGPQPCITCASSMGEGRIEQGKQP